MKQSLLVANFIWARGHMVRASFSSQYHSNQISLVTAQSSMVQKQSMYVPAYWSRELMLLAVCYEATLPASQLVELESWSKLVKHIFYGIQTGLQLELVYLAYHCQYMNKQLLVLYYSVRIYTQTYSQAFHCRTN